MFFELRALDLLVVDHLVLAYALHCVQAPRVYVLNKVDFSEGALAEHLLYLEVFETGVVASARVDRTAGTRTVPPL